MRNEMDRDEAIELITDALYHETEGSLLSIYNEYADNCRYEQIYDNDDSILNELLSNTEPCECIRMAIYGEYNCNDNYVTIDGYGNLRSFNNLFNYLELSEIAEYCLDNEESLGVGEIDTIIDQYNGDYEEDTEVDEEY